MAVAINVSPAIVPLDVGAPHAPTALASAACVAELLGSGHWVRVRVAGRSMHPRIPAGSVLTFAPVGTDALHRGDVVLYRSAGDRFMCHRLLACRQTGGRRQWGLRGDAFATAMEWIAPEAIVGCAVHCNGTSLRRPLPRVLDWLRAWFHWSAARTRIRLGSLRRRASP